MGIFGGLFNSLMDIVFDAFGKENGNALFEGTDKTALIEMFESRLTELSGMVAEISPYALKAYDS